MFSNSSTCNANLFSSLVIPMLQDMISVICSWCKKAVCFINDLFYFTPLYYSSFSCLPVFLLCCQVNQLEVLFSEASDNEQN